MLWIIGLVLVVLWLVAWLVLHVTSALIHLLLLVAIVMVVLHFMRRRSS